MNYRLRLFSSRYCAGECMHCCLVSDTYASPESVPEYACRAPSDSECPIVERVLERTIELLRSPATYRAVIQSVDDAWILDLYNHWKTSDAKAVGIEKEIMDSYCFNKALAEISLAVGAHKA